MSCVIVVLLLGCGEATESAPPETVQTLEEGLDPNLLFGTSCQEEFEGASPGVDGWRETLDGTGSMCSKFNASLDDVASKSYYTNLVGSKPFYEEGTLDQLYLETVDLHFNSSHGGAEGFNLSTQGAAFTMWNKDTRAFSRQMRLGDESPGLSVLASNSCGQLLNDGNVWTRWAPLMSGGLRIALAASGSIWFGSSSHIESGKKFADNLKAGQTFWGAWYSAIGGADSRNKPAALATGASDANCWSRLDNMKLGNFKTNSYGRLKDANIKSWCMRYTLP